jgi:hypothetical protein
MNNFERGRDPKEAIGLGYKEIFKSMEGCLLLTEKDLYQNINNQFYSIETIQLQNIRKQSTTLFEAFIIIIVFAGKFRILKNRISNDFTVYPIEELPGMVFKLKKLYDDWMKERGRS